MRNAIGDAPGASGTPKEHIISTLRWVTTSNENYRLQTSSITGDNLVTLKSKLRNGEGGTKKITFAIVREAVYNSTAAFMYTSNNDNNAEDYDYRPTLGVDYEVAKIGESSYTSLDEAWSALSDDTTEETIELYADVTIDKRYDATTGKTVNIVPMKDGIRLWRGGLDEKNIWFLTSSGKAATMNFGSDTYKLVFDGISNISNSKQVMGCESGAQNLNNVTFTNFKLGTVGSLGKTGGTLSLKNVIISNSSTDTQFFINGNGDKLVLNSSLNFINCIGTHINASGRIKVTDHSSFTASTPITISTSIALHGLVVLCQPATDCSAQIANFNLVDADFGLKNNGSHNYELMKRQAYTLSISSYGASTLVLPFASTIPMGVSAYKVSYSSGANSVTATEIKSTLDADTPVLINGTEGNYKFVSTATSGDAVSGEGNPSVGALVGTYTDATPVAEGNYVLYANESNPIGFYKAGASVTINANRAYLKSEGGSLARLAIVYGDETNAIEAVKAGIADDAIYTLSGVRVEQPTRGIYVKNGKKFIVK